MQAFDPGQDGLAVAAFSLFQANGLFDSLTFGDDSLYFVGDIVHSELILPVIAGQVPTPSFDFCSKFLGTL